MASHKRLSPGVEINEIDRSNYDTTDYSITDTATFVCGFADRGEDYTPQWINSMRTFSQIFGIPQNEPELYFKYAVQEVLNRGGSVIAAKLPYENKMKDNFNYVTYKLGDIIEISDTENPEDQSISARYGRLICEVDPTITAMLSVDPNPTVGCMTMDQLDQYKVDQMMFDKNRIVIVDISRQYYDDVSFYNKELSTAQTEIECLGIIPIVTTAANALFYQKLISSNTDYVSGGADTSEPGVWRTTSLSNFQPVTCISVRARPGLSAFDFGDLPSNLRGFNISSESIDQECVAKTAADCFPNILHLAEKRLDRDYLKHIGVAVFKAVKNQSDDSVEFQLVEAFAGSLDRTSKSPSGASDYICDVVNNRSTYINVFVNVDSKRGPYAESQILAINGQNAASLGFAKAERRKRINYAESIVKPLTRIFDLACNPNQIPIDVVCDAGVSNIAAFAKLTESALDDMTLENAEWYPFMSFDGNQLQSMAFDDAKAKHAWYAILQKYDDFCKGMRRDCIFLADMFRPFALDGNQKLVRGTNRDNTIEKVLVPRVRNLPQLNSSWSAGYCDWFYAQVPDTEDFFWCPPSIKACGVFMYCDAYFHTWSAPAGLTRGVVPGVYDVAFSPRNDEAGRIYQKAWNYAVSYPIQGIVMEGQKTFQIKPTALDRINVRRLMIWLEKRVGAAARRFLYEGNTAYTRQRFLDFIDPIFQEAKTGDGILDYAIRCDETLNTPDVIDNNELRCVIAVKPVKTIEWIVVNLICTNQSMSVSEEVTR